MPSTVNGLLVQWGDRLFNPSNRMTESRTPVLTEAAIRQRASLAGSHPRDSRTPRAAGDGQGHRRRAWHGCHCSAPALHRKGRATAHRGRPRCRARGQGGTARDHRSMAILISPQAQPLE